MPLPADGQRARSVAWCAGLRAGIVHAADETPTAIAGYDRACTVRRRASTAGARRPGGCIRELPRIRFSDPLPPRPFPPPPVLNSLWQNPRGVQRAIHTG